VFTLLNFLYLRSLAIPEADRVTVLSRDGDPLFSYPDYVDYRDRNRAFTALAATIPTESSLDVDREGRIIAAEAVSDNYIRVMGVHPVLGR
jgi:hypothetical protein